MSKLHVGLTGYTFSGASWVYNILFELGINDYDQNLFQHVRDIDNFHSEYRVREDTGIAHKHYLPSLTFKKKFILRNDIYLSNLAHHVLPNDLKDEYEHSRIIIMVRDPRDTLWSQYKSDTCNKPFYEFLRHFNPGAAWSHFYSMWLKHSPSLFVSFEGMKKDPYHWVQNILRFLEINRTDDEILEAINNSTSERSREAEMIHRSKLPEGGQVFKNIINRSGKIEQWKQLPEHQEAFRLIEAQTCKLASIFGYPMP